MPLTKRNPDAVDAEVRSTDRAGKADRPLITASRPASQPFAWSDEMITIMDGRRTVGFMLAGRGQTWRAFDDECRELGEFESRAAAHRAIAECARGAPA